MFKFTRLCALILFLFVPNAYSQWQVVHDFGNSSLIWSVYYLDFVGQPNIGLLGIDNHIYRTSDAGATWTTASSPNTSGYASNFAFKDGTTGWCSISYSSGLPAPSCYKTIDGGKTWFPLQVSGSAGDVYYNLATHQLLLSDRTGSLGVRASSDDGATWSVIFSPASHNGFAFSDPQYGVLSPGQTGNFLRTSDGGATWKATPFPIHCWAPCAEPVNGTLYAPNDLNTGIYTSSDKGLTWSLLGTGNPSPVTGCAHANECRLYFQTQDQLYAVGPDGTKAIGGPGNTVDSRFFLGKHTLYAGSDHGILMQLPIAAPSNPLLDPVTFKLADRCAVLDTFITVQNPNCSSYTLTALTLSDSTAFVLEKPTLPLKLSTDSLYRFALRIVAAGKVTAIVTIASSTGDTITRTITITSATSGPLPLKLAASGPRSFGITDACAPKDSVIALKNLLCDSIQLVSAAFEPANVGFSLQGLPTLPYRLLANEEDSVHVIFAPRDAVTERALLHLRFMVDGVVRDTFITFIGVGLKVIEASPSKTVVNFDSVSPCTPQWRGVYIVNHSCDSVLLTDLIVPGSGPVALVDQPLPKWIGSNDSLFVELQMTGGYPGGLYSDSLHAILNNGVQQRTVAVGMRGVLLPPLRGVSFSVAGILEDSLPPCTRFDSSITFLNHGTCDTIRIDSIRFEGTGTPLISVSTTLPATVSPDKGIILHVAFDAASGSWADGRIHIYSRTLDTTLTLHLSTRTDTGPLLTATVDRPLLTVHRCAADSSIVYFENESCLPAIVDSIILLTDDPSQSQFFLHSPVTLPIKLGSHERRAIRVDFIADGNGDGLATLRLHEASGSVSVIRIRAVVSKLDTANLAFNLVSASLSGLRPRDRVKTALQFTSDLNSVSELTSIRTVITVHTDFLSDISINGANGWTAVVEQRSKDRIQVLLTRSNPTLIKAGDELMSVEFQAALSDSLTTAIALNNVVFMPQDPTYMQCVLTGTVMTSPLQASFSTGCGDSMLSLLLQDHSPFSITSVSPNPLGANRSLQVTIEAHGEQTLSISVLNLLGETESNQMDLVPAGSHDVTIPMQRLSSGPHYLRFVSEGHTQMRKIVVE